MLAAEHMDGGYIAWVGGSWVGRRDSVKENVHRKIPMAKELQLSIIDR